ncbi:kinase-like domain-containing protein [Colletotrichum navitas]|uniref:Kinase-like domain-containing protein n=1 Tax=Colletotrichum navitas TaxID=681940 RepID=A0AAD8V4H2_9PEZI|nr:kinase-like domain-containing protein [Colletotrichum navitas]KAK1593957.1 kinase-like domain-containing protein [Colletotrichum navitas]
MSNRPPQSMSLHTQPQNKVDGISDPVASDTNSHNAAAPFNDISFSYVSNPQIQFQAHTIAPSPPLSESSFQHLDPPPAQRPASTQSAPTSSLRIQTTDFHIDLPTRPDKRSNATLSTPRRPGAAVLQHQTSSSSLKPVSRTPSFKAAIANSLGPASATSSCMTSPVLSAMSDVTPLPSPLLSGDSPGPWKRLGLRSPARHQMPDPTPDSVLVSTTGESIAAALANASKRKVYAGLVAEGADGVGANGPVTGKAEHARNRSISEYTPDSNYVPKRHVTVSGSHTKPANGPDPDNEPHMRRELNLAESRGLTPAIAQPPTPPPSESSRDPADTAVSRPTKSEDPEYFEAYDRRDRKRRRWRAVKTLGQGTFSRVMLATSQLDDDDGLVQAGGPAPISQMSQPFRKTLVAVKVCEHGPRGGASEERIEMSLKRELEIMQSISHPSLVHLKAWNIEPSRAILVLSHCPGGDLFDVATGHRQLLKPALLRRMFAELVGAVRYLHERRIVHRDIKLENVLVNLTAPELADPATDWTTYPHSVITLTDLGLSRRIADDEKLETRCGSEDYAAPEVIMGLPYDGRATDAWSLGVLLYALLEARLPFDPYPNTMDGHRMRSRTSHRIARAEWRWIEFAGEDGDHEGDEAKFKALGLLGAMEITEGLLQRARSRWTLEKVAEHQWVKEAIQVEGGLRFREEVEGAEV